MAELSQRRRPTLPGAKFSAVSITLTEQLVKKIDALASQRGKSRSEMVEYLLSMSLGDFAKWEDRTHG